MIPKETLDKSNYGQKKSEHLQEGGNAWMNHSLI